MGWPAQLLFYQSPELETIIRTSVESKENITIHYESTGQRLLVKKIKFLLNVKKIKYVIRI